MSEKMSSHGGKREGAGRPKKEISGNKRTLNWNFIVYPESAPKNWRDIINETRIEWVASPLHDKDTNPDNTPKKAHYHITLLFPSVKTYEQVKEITDSVNAPIPIKCQSVKGSIRYMVHKDNPEKFQYDWNDIKCYGGADLNALCAPTVTEKRQLLNEILTYIRNSDITEFEDLNNYALDNGLQDWIDVMHCYNTLSINALLRSRRHKAEKEMQQIAFSKPIKCNPDTGEVLDE